MAEVFRRERLRHANMCSAFQRQSCIILTNSDMTSKQTYKDAKMTSKRLAIRTNTGSITEEWTHQSFDQGGRWGSGIHVGSNEFKLVGLLPIEYRVEQLMLGHMFNIINGNAPTYLTSGIIMNQHRYSTRARELSCVIPRVKSSGLTSFMYQGVCHWNKLPLEIKQCPSKDTFKYQVKCLLYNRLLAQETSLYVRS